MQFLNIPDYESALTFFGPINNFTNKENDTKAKSNSDTNCTKKNWSCAKGVHIGMCKRCPHCVVQEVSCKRCPHWVVQKVGSSTEVKKSLAGVKVSSLSSNQKVLSSG